MIRARFLTAALAATMLLSACNSGAPTSTDPAAVPSNSAPPGTASPDPGWTQPATKLWSIKVKPLSEPTLVGKMVVMYVGDGQGGEEIQARNASNGKLRWSAPTAPGRQSPGVEHGVASSKIKGKDVVAFLSPGPDHSSNYTTTLKVVDAATGRDLAPALSSQILYVDRPSECGRTFCVDGQVNFGSPDTYAFNAARGRLTTKLPAGTQSVSSGRGLGDGLSSDVVAGTEYLNYSTDGQIHWSTPYQTAFARKYGSDNGWQWLEEHKDWPLIGFGYKPINKPDRPNFTYVNKLDNSMLVGLDRDSGKRLWALKKAKNCSGGDDMFATDQLVIACRVTAGKYTAKVRNGTGKIRAVGLAVEMIGIDPLTGKVTWTTPLGSSPANLGDALQKAKPVLSGEDPIVQKDGQAFTVDPATGQLTALPASATLLCNSSAPGVPLTGPYTLQGAGTYRATDILTPCRADGKRANSITAGTLSTTGQAGNLILANLKTGITAFRVK